MARTAVGAEPATRMQLLLTWALHMEYFSGSRQCPEALAVIRSASRTLCLLAALFAGSASALECGGFDFPFCKNAAGRPDQFAGGFAPHAPNGGFGGGAGCRGNIRHTPVVFVHGNGDSAIGWDSPAPARGTRAAGPSVYEEFKAHGYNDCELFGITYLDRDEQKLDHTGQNFHEPRKYQLVWEFIQAVKAYTGSPRVDVVGHSLGVSMAMAALDYYADHGEKAWESVRRFANIAGGIRGLNSCVPATFTAAACQADHGGTGEAYYEFGFFPDHALFWRSNRWTAAEGPSSMRHAPQRHPNVLFYTIEAGNQDDIHCPSMFMFWPTPVDCRRGPLFAPAANVRAQLDIGAAPASPLPPWTGRVKPEVASLFPNDLGGIGHFGARDYAGPILLRMLATDCTDLACAQSYAGEARRAQP
ncbi:MAG: hypothetical protein ACM3Y9_11865 [Ignavibacteria bacterium]